MNKEVGEKYGLKHGFIINRWAAPDIPRVCVTPLGTTGGTSGRSTAGFLCGASLSPPASPSRLGCGTTNTPGDQRAEAVERCASSSTSFPGAAAKPLIPLPLSTHRRTEAREDNPSEPRPPAGKRGSFKQRVGSARLPAPSRHRDTTFPLHALVCPGWVTARPSRHA